MTDAWNSFFTVDAAVSVSALSVLFIVFQIRAGPWLEKPISRAAAIGHIAELFVPLLISLIFLMPGNPWQFGVIPASVVGLLSTSYYLLIHIRDRSSGDVGSYERIQALLSVLISLPVYVTILISRWLPNPQAIYILASLCIWLLLSGLFESWAMLVSHGRRAIPGNKKRTTPSSASNPASGTEFPSPGTSPRLLEPMNEAVLVRRTLDIFPAGYMMNISIIQGVALSVAVGKAIPSIASAATPAVSAIYVAESALIILAIVVVSYQYLWFSNIMRWAPTLRDTALPYLLGLGEIIPALLIDRPVAFWGAFVGTAAMGTAAYLNTLSRLEGGLFVQAARGDDPASVVRRLLRVVTFQCVAAMIGGTITLVLVATLPPGALLFVTLAAIIVIAVPISWMLGFSESRLNEFYALYRLDRTPPSMLAGLRRLLNRI